MLLLLVNYLAQCFGGLGVELFEGGNLFVKVAQNHTFNRDRSGCYRSWTNQSRQRTQREAASPAKMVAAASA